MNFPQVCLKCGFEESRELLHTRRYIESVKPNALSLTHTEGVEEHVAVACRVCGFKWKNAVVS